MMLLLSELYVNIRQEAKTLMSSKTLSYTILNQQNKLFLNLEMLKFFLIETWRINY